MVRTISERMRQQIINLGDRHSGRLIYRNGEEIVVQVDDIAPNYIDFRANYVLTLYSNRWYTEYSKADDDNLLNDSVLILEVNDQFFVFSDAHYSHQIFDQLFLGNEREKNIKIYYRLCTPERTARILESRGLIPKTQTKATDPIQILRRNLWEV